MSNRNELPFSIFPSPLSYTHQSASNIYQTLLLQQPFLVLVITIQKQYFLYRLHSQSKATIQSEGRLQNQLADNFQQVIINNKSYLLYQVEDCVYLHDLKLNQTVDRVVFRENKFGHSVIYEEEYKYSLVKVFRNPSKFRQQQMTHIEEVPFVILFWKTSALYKTGGNRELSVQVKLLTIRMKTNEVVKEKLSLLTQLTLETHHESQTFSKPYFLPHLHYTKPIKLQSQTFLDFTFGFNHPISYQTEGYHLQLNFLSNLGQVKKKFTINSIYNQLVKQVIPVSNSKMLIITKHESMNLQEMQQQQQQGEENQQQGENQGNIEQDITQDERLMKAEHQLFREDFRIISGKVNKQVIHQKYRHLFEFQQQQQSHEQQQNHFEEDQRVDIYSITLQTAFQEQDSNIQIQLQTSQIKATDISDLKLTKLYSSLPIKDISQPLSITPNVVNNLPTNLIIEKLQLLDGNDDALKLCNHRSDSKETVNELYYENLFTKRNGQFRERKIKGQALEQDIVSLFKLTYSKKALYIKMLEDLWGQTNLNECISDKEYSTKSNEQNNKQNTLQNQSELNYNQTDIKTHPRIINSHTQNPFIQTILSLLID